MPIRLTPIEPPVEPPETEASSGDEVNAETGVEAGEGAVSSNGHAPVLRYSRYQELDHTDLLHIIEELEDNRNWTSLREKLWIALIIHLIVVWFLLYGEKYVFPHPVRVVTPQAQLKQERKHLTFLALPKDLQKVLKPPPTHIISDQNRIAETPHPKPVLKTPQQLQAMQRSGPPKIASPNLPRQTPAPAARRPQPQQEEAQSHPRPPAQPLPQNNHAQLTAPPQAPVPNFRTGPTNPNSQLQNEMRQAMRGSLGQMGGNNGMNAPSAHQGEYGAVDILSDTLGVNFGPYIQRVIYDTERAWYPIIPDEARPPFNKQGQVYITFKILRNGDVADMQLTTPSGDVALDRAAWAGITGASPFPPLPKAFTGPYLELRFDFLYNESPGGE